jgi:tetratricopeptide (TPR) repeat protein
MRKIMRRKFRSFVVVSVLLGGLIFPFAPSASLFSVRAPKTAGKTNGYAARLGAFEDFVRRQMKSDGTIGMTIGFIKDDYTWVKAFGYSDFENRVPAKPESMYRLASITKTMTSIAVLQLVEQGKIDIDALFKKANELNPRAEASADSLNRFAYDLSSKGKVEAGLRLLETAIEIYPREANLYDSAGEFYMGLGKKEKAVEFYTKALEIDPNYSNAANAREILKKLRRE